MNKDALLFLLLIILMAVAIAIGTFGPDFLPPRLPQVQTNGELPGMASLGKADHSFDDFLDKLKKDLGFKDIEITLVVGPFFRHDGIGSRLYVDYQPSYFILADVDLYNKLTAEEKTAFIAHEAAHMIFRYPSDNSFDALTENQKLADQFAARHVDPKYIKSLLRKAFSDYWARQENLDRLSKDRK